MGPQSRINCQGLKLALIVGAICSLPASSQATDYVGYTDHDYFYGFTCVSSSIEYVSSIVVGGVSVWCGIDDGCSSIWLQVGWRNYGVGPRRYYEYTTEDGFRGVVDIGIPPTVGEYEVFEAGGVAYLQVAGTIETTLPWSWFDDRLLLQAQYGAELHGYPGDYVPGGAYNVCSFANVRNGTPARALSAASLASPLQDAGGLLKSGNSFWFWDPRTP